MTSRSRSLCWGLSAALLFCVPSAQGEDLPEYRLKAAFVYNFIVYTEWPPGKNTTLNVCILGTDPFGAEIDGMQGKSVAGLSIVVQRKPAGEPFSNCQVVFIPASAMQSLPRLLENLRGQPVLTVADTPGAMRQGVALNMAVSQGRVTFEANLQAARRAGLNLSSKLLRLATEVKQ